MRYLRVRWHHNHPREPVEIYSEADDAGWETRKVEVFRDGTAGFAGPDEVAGPTVLGERSLPALEEIAADAQLEPAAISKEEFEKVWAKRRTWTRSAS